MKKILLAMAATLILAAPAYSQQNAQVQRNPDCQFSFRFTATGRQPSPGGAGQQVGFDNRQSACTTWHFMYTNTGFSALSIEIDQAPDSGGTPGAWVVWPSANVLGAYASLPLTTTTVGQLTAYKYASWVSVNLTSVTGTGQVQGTVVGWRPYFQDSNALTFALDNAGHGTVNQGNGGVGSSGAFTWITTIMQSFTLMNAAPTVSAANTAATVTLTGAAGARVCVRTVAIKATGAAATFTLTVQDGATIVLDLGTQSATLTGPALLFQGTPLLCGTQGNTVTVNIGAGGAAAVTTTSVIADRQ
jgi:hypothetical protein